MEAVEESTVRTNTTVEDPFRPSSFWMTCLVTFPILKCVEDNLDLERSHSSSKKASRQK